MAGGRRRLVVVWLCAWAFGCSRPAPTTQAPASQDAPNAPGPSVSAASTSSPAPVAASSAAHITRQVRYLALGDSFTIGTGSSPEQAFPSKLVERWRAAGRDVVLENPARNGFSTADVLADETPLLVTFRPTFVTLAVGANDIARRRSEAVYRDTLRQISTLVKASGAVLVGLPQPDWAATPVGASFGAYDVVHARIEAYNRILREEIEAAGGRWVDLSPLMERQAKARLVATDGLHPSAAAYAEWADALAQAKLLPTPP